jgi:hypothetical protein
MNLGRRGATAPHHNAGLDDEMPSSRRGAVCLDIPFYRTVLSSSGFLGQTPYSENLLRGGASVSARNLVLNTRRKFRIAPSDEQQIVTPYEIGCFVAANAIHMEP